jgi:hypothetical protein
MYYLCIKERTITKNTTKMKTIKITKADLIGRIENFPIEVVEKMVEEQVRQGNRADVSVFQRCAIAGADVGGFDWCATKESRFFWVEVITEKNFEKFFKKYPKANRKVFIIGDSEIGIDIIKTLEDRGGINRYGLEGKDDDVIYYIDPVCNIIKCTNIGTDTYNVVSATFECIAAEEHKIVVSLQKVAELLGVDVSRIAIKA